MLIVTNRALDGTGAGAMFSKAFTPGAIDLNLAEAKPGTGDKWKLDKTLAAGDDAAIVDRLLPVFQGDRPVLVYVHGNNNTPAKCFARCAVLEAMYGVQVVGFSWASEGSMPNGQDLPGQGSGDAGDEDDLGEVTASNRSDGPIRRKINRYIQAKTNAQLSVDALARFLRLVSVARMQAHAQPFSLVAHSLGGHFLQYTLELQSAREALGTAFNVTLAAPCVRAAGHADWLTKLRPRGKVFVTYNAGDSVLLAATLVDSGATKLGLEPGPDLVRNGLVRYICFTNSKTGGGGHGYFVHDGLSKKTKAVLGRIFSSEVDIRSDEFPRKVYPNSCDADGAVCYVGLPIQADGN